MSTAATTTEIPATLPITQAPLSLREHTEATEKGLTDVPNPAAKVTPGAPPKPAETAKPADAAAAATTPEQEAESTKPDAELSEAGRLLRKNRADERKARIQREIDEAVRERQQTRADLEREREELARLRREREDLTRGHQPRQATAGAAPAGTTDPNDPEPVERDYEDYSQFVADKARWAAREEMRQQQQQSRARIAREAADRAAQETASKLDEQHATTREKFADFDAVIDPVIAQVRGTPRGSDMGAFFATSEVGGEVLYRLGKDPKALEVVLKAPNRAALHRALTHVETDILAARKSPKPTTNAPAPPAQTVGGGPTATDVDTLKGVSTRDHIRIENEREIEARRSGRRY